QVNGSIERTGSEQLAIRTVRQAVNHLVVSAELGDDSAAGHVPDVNNTVPSSGRELRPVGTEYHTVGLAGRPEQLVDQGSRGRVPKGNSVLAMDGRQQSSLRIIGRPRWHTPVIFLGRLQYTLRMRVIRVPQREVSLGARNRSELPTIRTEDERGDRLLMGQQAGRLTGGEIPEAHAAVPARRRQPLAVRAEDDVVNKALVPAQDAMVLRQAGIPDAKGAVPLGDHEAAARHKRSRCASATVATQNGGKLSPPRVPQPQLFVAPRE